MQKAMVTVFVLALAAVMGTTTASAQSVREQVERGCKQEIQGFCSNVTPGQGRVLACLYAHSDKLSGQCEFALYDASVRLERAVSALTYVAKECDDDIDKMCANVEAGEGRVINCLKSNADAISRTCKRAMTDVGLME